MHLFLALSLCVSLEIAVPVPSKKESRYDHEQVVFLMKTTYQNILI